MSCADGSALLLTCSGGSSNPDGTVGYATRRCLHDASDGDHGPRFARIFSGVLAIDCARRSFGLWQDGGGWCALGDFERIGLADLDVAASPDDARDWLARAEAEVMQAYYDGTSRFQNTAGLAGLSCLRGVGACIGRFRFDPDGDEEIDIEPDYWDSAFLSACALAVRRRDVDGRGGALRLLAVVSRGSRAACLCRSRSTLYGPGRMEAPLSFHRRRGKR